MRARNIKPGYFKNEELAACTPLARILFAGLWCMADRDGRMKDRPKRIKADVLPYDDCDVEVLLGELKTHGFIDRYEAEGQTVLQVSNFIQHQRPHPKEPSESLPAKPCTNPARTRRKISGSGTAVASSGKSVASCALPSFPSESLISESTSLNPLLPPSGGGAAKVAKPRDELFDAICEVTGTDPKASGSHVGKVKRALLLAEPPYTPGEVRKLPAALAAGGLTVPLTLGVIEKYIGWTRNAPARSPPANAGGRPDQFSTLQTWREQRKAANDGDAGRIRGSDGLPRSGDGMPPAIGGPD